MTGLGRASAGYFASHAEKIQPDYLCIAKGLTGGYLPMAAADYSGGFRFIPRRVRGI